MQPTGHPADFKHMAPTAHAAQAKKMAPTALPFNGAKPSTIQIIIQHLK